MTLTQDENLDPDDPKTGLPKSFTKPLQKQITALVRRQQNELLHPDLAADYIFPTLPGSYLKFDNPALQLVKSITQVLSLDRTLNLSVRQLRGQLLALFDIREFSAAAAFTNPSATLLVKGLVCEECCSVRDLDLCRDADILPPLEAAVHASDAAGLQQLQSLLPKWRCQACNATFDRLRIEERLVSKVQKYQVQWATQDLKCAKCKRLRANEFMEHCACAGEWVGTVEKTKIQGKLEIMGRVAQWYGLGLLGDVVQEMRDGL